MILLEHRSKARFQDGATGRNAIAFCDGEKPGKAEESMYFWLLNFRCYTVKPVFKGHPRAMAKWPLNKGWPLNTGVLKFKIRVKWEWHFVWHWIILRIFRLKTLARWYEKTVTMKIQTKQKPSGVNVVHLFIQNFTWRVPNRVFLSRNPDPKFRAIP